MKKKVPFSCFNPDYLFLFLRLGTNPSRLSGNTPCG